jgi:ribosomal protein L11 methyltransferase
MEFWELTVPTTAETTEGLTNFLWEQGALGVVEEQTPPTPPRLRAFYAASASSTALLRAVETYRAGLRAMQFDIGGDAEIHPIHDEQWASAWQQSFPPLSVGERLFVAPPWETAPTPAGRLRIVIEPGRAFGTGHHGSTAGCLEAIERAVDDRVPARALDLGTGSGILAIALARLGVADVLAVDEDPDAIAATTANADRNGVTAAVTGFVEDVTTLEVPPAPLVVANLITAAHHRLADRYTRYVTPGGRLILSGILDGEAANVDTALRSREWEREATIAREGWSTLLLTRSRG